MAAGPFQTRLEDEDLVRERHEVPLLIQDPPVFDLGEAVREGIRIHREEPLLDDLVRIEQERAEPRRQEEHRARRNGSARKSVSAYRDLERAFFFGAPPMADRGWGVPRIPLAVVVAALHRAG